MVVGIWLAYFNKQVVLKTRLANQLSGGNEQVAHPHHHGHDHAHHQTEKTSHPLLRQIRHLLQHSLDEFFDTGRLFDHWCVDRLSDADLSANWA